MVTYISIGSCPIFKTEEVLSLHTTAGEEHAQWGGMLAACFLRRVVEEGRDWLSTEQAGGRKKGDLEKGERERKKKRRKKKV